MLARPDRDGQDPRRRAAGRRVRRLGGADGADRAGRRRLPGRHAEREPAGGRRRAARRCTLLDEEAYLTLVDDDRARSPTGCARPPATARSRSPHDHRAADRLLRRRSRRPTTRAPPPATPRPTAPGAARCSPAASTRRRRSSRPGSRRSRTQPSTSRAPSRRPPPRSRRSHERARARWPTRVRAEGGLLADDRDRSDAGRRAGAAAAAPPGERLRAARRGDPRGLPPALRRGPRRAARGPRPRAARRRPPVRARARPAGRARRPRGGRRARRRDLAAPRRRTPRAIPARASAVWEAGAPWRRSGRDHRPQAHGAAQLERRPFPRPVDIVRRVVPSPSQSSRSPKYTAERNDPGRLRGRDRHPPALHGRHRARRRRRRHGRVRRCPALGFAVGSRALRAAARALGGGRQARGLPGRHLRPARDHDRSPGIGEVGKTTVYMRARNPKIDKPPNPPGRRRARSIAISTRCMHLGCPVRYVAGRRSASSARATAASTTSTGKVVGGPPVRPLDRFYTRVARRQRRGRAALLGQHRVQALPELPRSRRRPSTASASTSTRGASRPRSSSSRLPTLPKLPPVPKTLQPAPEAPGRGRAGQAARPGQGGRDPRRRLDRRAHLAVRRRPLGDVPQGPEGDELVLHARLGDDVRLPRRRPSPASFLAMYYDAVADATPTSRPATSPTTSSSASSCAGCTSGARR